MAYKVIGAAAVVELDDGNTELGTGSRVYLEHDGLVPSNAKAKHVEHLLNIELIEEVATPDAPAASADASSDGSDAAKSGKSS